MCSECTQASAGRLVRSDIGGPQTRRVVLKAFSPRKSARELDRTRSGLPLPCGHGFMDHGLRERLRDGASDGQCLDRFRWLPRKLT